MGREPELLFGYGFGSSLPVLRDRDAIPNVEAATATAPAHEVPIITKHGNPHSPLHPDPLSL